MASVDHDKWSAGLPAGCNAGVPARAHSSLQNLTCGTCREASLAWK